MAKTNSYQRAKARVAELEEALNVSFIESQEILAQSKKLESENTLLKFDNNRIAGHLKLANNALGDSMSESAYLKRQLTKGRNTTKAFIVLSMLLTIGIIVLIATI